MIARDKDPPNLTCDYCGLAWTGTGETAIAALRESAKAVGWVTRRLLRFQHDYCKLCTSAIAATEDLRRNRKRR